MEMMYIKEYMFTYFCMSVNNAESMKDPFREADLLPMLKKMLEDPVGAVEVKFSALGLICSLANSSMCLILKQHIEIVVILSNGCRMIKL